MRAVGVGLHPAAMARSSRLDGVGLDDEVGQPHLRGHAGALGARGAEHDAAQQRATSNSSSARWAAPTAGIAAVIDSIGGIGMRTR